MENITERSYRMYGLVPYNISPIQQGIQFGHAVVEYGLTYGNKPEYHRWSRKDKTFIILNGGTTNTSNTNYGSLNTYDDMLGFNGIKRTRFYEPDLGDQLTAIVFIADDRVFDKKAWPDYEGDAIEEKLGGRSLDTQYYEWKMKFADTEEEADRIIFLREFLSKLKLA
jgi:hypothetical protein